MSNQELIRQMVELGVLKVADGGDPIDAMIRFEGDELQELRQIRLRAQAELLVRIFANDGFLLNRMFWFNARLRWWHKALAFLGLTKTPEPQCRTRSTGLTASNARIASAMASQGARA